jgi:hypothetical protein
MEQFLSQERRIAINDNVMEPEKAGGDPVEEASLSEKAEKVARLVTEEIREESSKRAKRFLVKKKESLAEELGKASGVFHESSRSFQERDQVTVARYVDQIAQQADKYTLYPRETNLDQLEEEVKTVARKNPGLFLLSAFTTGLGMSRFLKSSGSRRTSTQDAQVDASPTGMQYQGGSYGAKYTRYGSRMVGESICPHPGKG